MPLEGTSVWPINTVATGYLWAIAIAIAHEYRVICLDSSVKQQTTLIKKKTLKRDIKNLIHHVYLGTLEV